MLVANQIVPRETRPGLGFITMAYGPDRFFKQAETLARSLRMHMPDIPLALVTDRADPGSLFDIVVPMEPIGTAGTLHKIRLYKYSPFEETLFIDSDCLVVRPFDDCLNTIRARDFTPIVSTFLKDGDRDLWLDDVGRAVRAVGGRSFPKFNGGIYFFRKGPIAEKVFEETAALLPRAAELGIRNFDSAGPGDETLIGLAMAKLGLDVPFDDNGRFMRTPLGSKGEVVADPFTGQARFWKYGRVVEPAIVHYCGPWIKHPTYTLATAALERGRPVSSAQRWLTHLTFNAQRLKEKVVRKLKRSRSGAAGSAAE